MKPWSLNYCLTGLLIVLPFFAWATPKPPLPDVAVPPQSQSPPPSLSQPQLGTEPKLGSEPKSGAEPNLEAEAQLGIRPQLRTAIFAGGNFWSMEKPFDVLEGVVATVVGYIGGREEHPSHKQVISGATGHLEAVQITFDAQIISYQQLLAVYWQNIDPLDDQGQFCDQGEAFLTAIFYLDETQKNAAEQSAATLIEKRWVAREIKTQIRPASTFYTADDYQQNFYQSQPKRYAFYLGGCRREERLQSLWGDKKIHFNAHETPAGN